MVVGKVSQRKRFSPSTESLKELRQGSGRYLDIRGSEHTRDHGNAISPSIDDLLCVGNGNAANRKDGHVYPTFRFLKNADGNVRTFRIFRR